MCLRPLFRIYYPQAVTNNVVEAIPDIYKIAEIKDGWIALKTDLQKGDKVKLIFENKEELAEVLETNNTGFKVSVSDSDKSEQALKSENTKVFVYGREVSDFHTVDYEAIAMLNVSATQELARGLLEAENELERKNKETETMKAQVKILMNERTNQRIRISNEANGNAYPTKIQIKDDLSSSK